MITINDRPVQPALLLEKLPMYAQLDHGPDIGSIILPDGIRAAWQAHGDYYFVHEIAPAVHALRWSDSPLAYGSSITSDFYRTVRISLPYIILVIELDRYSTTGEVLLGANMQAYFRNAPLHGINDPLCYPVLRNCFTYGDETNVCAVSSQSARQASALGNSFSDAVRRGIPLAVNAFLHSGFNLHGDDLFDMYRWHLDPCVKDIATWEQSTIKDPAFSLTVPWPVTNVTIAKLRENDLRPPRYTASQLEQIWQRHIFNP